MKKIEPKLYDVLRARLIPAEKDGEPWPCIEIGVPGTNENPDQQEHVAAIPFDVAVQLAASLQMVIFDILRDAKRQNNVKFIGALSQMMKSFKSCDCQTCDIASAVVHAAVFSVEVQDQIDEGTASKRTIH